jgi:hypothetical protein
MSNREPNSTVISPQTGAAAGLDADQETPDAVREFDQTLTAILTVFGMVASPKAGESAAIAEAFDCERRGNSRHYLRRGDKSR